jgi:KDO2-lipid IV(A) lauroyltransferase
MTNERARNGRSCHPHQAREPRHYTALLVVIPLMQTVLAALGSLLARAAFTFGIRKSVTMDNLRHAFRSLNETELNKLAAQSYGNLGAVFFEMLYLRFASRDAIEQRLRITNQAEIEAVLREGKGMILLSAHLANWEWMAMGTALHLKQPLYVIVKNQRDGYAERFLQAMRTRFGNIMIGAGDVRAAFRVLQSGKILAMLGDQAAPAESVKIDFFGRKVPTFEGVARFALRTSAPIYLAECIRTQDGGYEMTFHNVPFTDLNGATPENVEELTTRHTALLEKIIRQRPELWLWQHKRWKDARE